jgi:hypothetical protein
LEDDVEALDEEVEAVLSYLLSAPYSYSPVTLVFVSEHVFMSRIINKLWRVINVQRFIFVFFSIF